MGLIYLALSIEICILTVLRVTNNTVHFYMKCSKMNLDKRLMHRAKVTRKIVDNKRISFKQGNYMPH